MGGHILTKSTEDKVGRSVCKRVAVCMFDVRFVMCHNFAVHFEML